MDRNINIFYSRRIVDYCADKSHTSSIKINSSLLRKQLPENPAYETHAVISGDCTITALLQEYPRYNKILVLNMANASRIGGGWLTGAEAQEEYLFRRTDLHKTLVDNLYPMGSSEVIYSPLVRVIFDASYVELEDNHYVSFISVAAVDRPYIINGHLTPHTKKLTYDKIKLIFHVAALNHHDCLILGALGCGAFRNPPGDIASIFADVCSEYQGYFKKIVFAIKCVNDDVNAETFEEVFLERFNQEA